MIFKNFPKASSLVKNNILDQHNADMVYKLNRMDPDKEEMIKLLKSLSRFEKAGDYLDDWERQYFSPPSRRRMFMELISFLSDGFSGIEFIGIHKRYQCNVEHLNAGDQYTTTLVFYLHSDGTARISCWEEAVGSVETNRREDF